MPLAAPYPDLEQLIAAMADAGRRLSDANASEGAAGNISVCIGWSVDVAERFPISRPFALPQRVPALVGHTLIVTGSGRRLRDIDRDPDANLCAVVVGGDGQSAQLHVANRALFQQPTSELNSHLAVHDDQCVRSGTNFNALIHVQPPYLTYLSHIGAYRDERHLNRRLLRWEPETIVHLPEGIGVVPFLVPGSDALMAASVEGLRAYRLIIWSKHGVMARSDTSPTRAADLIEYAELAARFEYMDLVNRCEADGLSVRELRDVVQAFDVRTHLVPGASHLARPSARSVPL